jgi:tetratricopeptide (TPR) repeat protein
MFSFKKWSASASAACLLLGLSVVPLFSQAVAERKPQPKTKAEYDAYMLLYEAAAPAKKVELAEKFLTDYPETEFKIFVYQMQIDSYARLGNPDKVVETGEKFETEFPQADNNTRQFFQFFMQRMMTAYQQKNEFLKAVEYGDKLLAINPKDLPSLLTLSSILSARLPLPTEEDKKAAQLNKALDYSNRAKAEIELLRKPPQITDEEWTTEKNKLLATVNSNIALVHRSLP